MLLQKRIQKLPTDIINCIIPYTYNLQNKTLLDDIKNYTETKEKVFEVYHNFWITHLGGIAVEDKLWLLSNIFSYINDYQAIMYGYVDNFYNVFFRNLSLRTIDDVTHFLNYLKIQNANTQINIIWGLLISTERNEVIRIFE